MQKSQNEHKIRVPDEREINDNDVDADEQQIQELSTDAEDIADEGDQEHIAVIQQQTPSQDDILLAENTKTLEHMKRNKTCSQKKCCSRENGGNNGTKCCSQKKKIRREINSAK